MGREMSEDLFDNKQGWEREILEPVLRRYPERGDSFETSSGIEVERVYTPQEAEIDYVEDLGFPGQYPFTRGVHPTMYRGRLWTMRQYAGYATAEESNHRYKYLLSQGATGRLYLKYFPIPKVLFLFLNMS